MKKEKGITLIALIVTIVILIILASVTINLLFGNNGIFSKAKYAGESYKQAALEEEYMSLLVNTVRQNISYEESKESIDNPDRGFYLAFCINLEDGKGKIESLKSRIKDLKRNKFSLIHLRIDIGILSSNSKGTVDRDFTQEELDNLNEYFSIIRDANLKTIVRFAYEYEGEYHKEPSFDKILKHVDQLSTVFTQNKDIITLIEAGMIGPWGEMHDSKYNTIEYQNKLIDALLKAAPSPIHVNVRTPAMYTGRFGSEPIKEDIAYTNQDAARVGIFNDGYLGSETDLGTYTNREEAIKWLTSHTAYTIFGGEVTIPESTYNDIDNVKEEAFKTHTTYLNYEWNNNITQNKWKNSIYTGQNKVYSGESALKYIEDHMGYRFVLKNSEISDKVKQGEKFAINLSIENTGFGNTINEKKVSLILEKEGKYYQTDLNVNTRNWMSNTQKTELLIMSVPTQIEEGEWNIYLKINDIENSKYVIKFANSDVFETSLKANYIGKINIIHNENAKQEVYFKQLNSNLESTNNTLKPVEGEKIIDGKISSRFEWNEQDNIYNQNQSNIYISEDNENVYMYLEDNDILANPNLQIKFALSDSSSTTDYKYILENVNLYKAENTSTTLGVLTKEKLTGIEYRIPKSIFLIDSIEDIIAINVTIVDNSWNSVKNIEIINISKAVDGKITSEDEWNESKIIYQNEESKIYYRVEKEKIYLYYTDTKI